ncbi:MAG: arylmalonate decarboxylase [Lachnospiraceae bacterium]|nr:arylmalonate decarboxylase [Lachnospiraceae bacterium]
MSGWRARIGLISPIGESIERAFNRYVPEGVAVNSTKLWFPGPTIEGLIHLSDQLEKAAEMYKKQRHELLMFGCTSGSMVKGYGFDKECIRRMEKVSGVPAITTSTAVLEAFDILGMPKAAVLTPYPDETNDMEKRFLEDNGIHVTGISGMDCSPIRQYGVPEVSRGIVRVKGDMGDIEPSQICRAVREMDLGDAQCLFISCTGLNTMEIISLLEEDLGMPVITSNQASLYSALRHCNVRTCIPELGQLFTRI